MRYFAIINTHDNVDSEHNLIEKLPKNDSKILKFRFDNTQNEENVVVIPNELKNKGSKIINYVQKYFFDNNIKDFVHVIDDTIEILKNPDVFLNEIEVMMKKLDNYEWYNTVTDPMNYTFKLYNPRFAVELDTEEIKKTYPKTIYFTSHANTLWMCYDFSKCTPEKINLDEDFEIAMYYIIEHLAERRNKKNKGDIYYMNFYPTVIEEKGLFRQITVNEEYTVSEEEQTKEAIYFKSKNINHSADMKIEAIMDDLLEKIR